MDQLVALLVQVDALGGHVAGEQEPDRLRGQAELLDDALLLLLAGGVAVHDLDDPAVRLPGLGFLLAQVRLPHPRESESGRDGLGQPLQGGNALGEDHNPGVRTRADTNLFQDLDQGFELGRIVVAEVVGEARQVDDRLPLDLPRHLQLSRVLALAALQGLLKGLGPGGDGDLEGAVRGEERLQQVVRDHRIHAHGGGRRVARDPARGELRGDRLLLLGHLGEDRLGRTAVRPFALEGVAHLTVRLGAADVQVPQVLHVVGRWIGDRRVVQHADQLGEGLGVPVVRSGGGQHEGIAATGEEPG